MSQINLKQTDYGTEAYEMALEWYLANGPLPIPRLTEEQCAAQGLPDYSVFFQPPTNDLTNNQSVRIGKDFVIEYVSIEFVPIIAAIKAEFSERTILEFLLHHNVKQGHFSSIHADVTTPIFKSALGKDLYLHDIFISVVKSLDFRPTGRRLLEELASSNQYNSELSIGLLHAEDPKHWSDSRIRKLSYDISRNDYHATPHYTTFDELSDSLASTSCFPDNSAMEYLRRSGMLNNDLIRKRSANYGMWETTLKRLVIDKPAALDMFIACANATIPAEQAIIRRALKSMTMDSYDASISPSYALERLKDVLVDSPVQDVLESDVLKLNLMSLGRPQDFEGHDGGAAGYETICAQNSELISRLAAEVMSIPADTLGYSNFGCWRRLPLLNLMPQRLPVGTPEALVIHMLKGFDQYTYPDNTTDEKVEVDGNARAGLKDMVQVLACHHDFDYSAFQDLSSSHKKDLIKMGLDVYKLPGLSLPELGDVFSHGLGL